MSRRAVARRYAKALYELASEESTAGAVGGALRQIAGGVASAGREELAEGALGTEARCKIGDRLAEAVGRDTTLGRFVRLVAERDRLAYLPEIAEWYERLEDEAAGRVRAAIKAAVPLTDADVEAFRAAFRRIAEREVVADVVVDPDLLGGAVVELEGRVYDGSVKTALARLASRMAGAHNGAAPRSDAPRRQGKKNANQSV